MKLLALAAAALIGGPVPSADPTDACVVAGAEAGTPTEPTDVERALAACAVARARFTDLFGDPAPPVRVVLWERPSYRAGVQAGSAVVFWPSTTAMAGRDAGAGAGEGYLTLQWEEVLPHEISHVLLAARFWAERHRAAAGGDGYATPFPDWLDEAVAIWAEPVASRRDRLREAQGLPDGRRDLFGILRTPHPAVGDPSVLAMRDGTPAPANPDLASFYPQSIAVLAFVYDAGGPAAVSELARRLVRDPESPDALLGLPGLAHAGAELEERWALWLRDGLVTSLAAR